MASRPVASCHVTIAPLGDILPAQDTGCAGTRIHTEVLIRIGTANTTDTCIASIVDVGLMIWLGLSMLWRDHHG